MERGTRSSFASFLTYPPTCQRIPLAQTPHEYQLGKYRADKSAERVPGSFADQWAVAATHVRHHLTHATADKTKHARISRDEQQKLAPGSFGKIYLSVVGFFENIWKLRVKPGQRLAYPSDATKFPGRVASYLHRLRNSCKFSGISCN